MPSLETAQNRDRSGDQQTSCHAFASAAALAVQLVPLGEVITRFVPSNETAQNKDSSGDQQTAFHEFASAAVLAVNSVISICVPPVQLVPLDEYAVLFPVATNKASDSDHITLLYVPAGIVLAVHVSPSGEDAATLAPTATQRLRVGE